MIAEAKALWRRFKDEVSPLHRWVVLEISTFAVQGCRPVRMSHHFTPARKGAGTMKRSVAAAKRGRAPMLVQTQLVTGPFVRFKTAATQAELRNSTRGSKPDIPYRI